MSDDSKSSANRSARDGRKEAYLREMLDRHAEQFRALGNANAPAAARKVHAAMDALLEQDRKKSPDSGEIRCRKGCDHCCRGPVEIWPHEAELLVEAAREAGIELDQAHLE